MPRPTRKLWLAIAVVVPLSSMLSACGSSDSNDPEKTGPTKQAVEQLRDYGLSAKEAACIVEEVGADSVIEAADLNAFAQSQQYQDAAKACIDGN